MNSNFIFLGNVPTPYKLERQYNYQFPGSDASNSSIVFQDRSLATIETEGNDLLISSLAGFNQRKDPNSGSRQTARETVVAYKEEVLVKNYNDPENVEVIVKQYDPRKEGVVNRRFHFKIGADTINPLDALTPAEGKSEMPHIPFGVKVQSIDCSYTYNQLYLIIQFEHYIPVVCGEPLESGEPVWGHEIFSYSSLEFDVTKEYM